MNLDTREKICHIIATAIIVAFFFMLFVYPILHAVLYPSSETQESIELEVEEAETLLIQYINKYRREIGLNELEVDEGLMQYARDHVAFCALGGVAMHSVYNFSRGEVVALYSEEDLIMTNETVMKILQLWKQSYEHNEIITGSKWRYIGCSLAWGTTKCVAVCMFTTQKVEPPKTHGNIDY